MSESKYDWKKQEKLFYGPKSKPEIIEVPAFKFFTIKGKGNPNDSFFGDYIGVLYSLAYTIKMSLKSGQEPDGYYEYSVYPLEGIWDLSDEAKKFYNGAINKNDLVFKLMIRQPDFVSDGYATEVIKRIKVKKPHALLDQVQFETIEEGKCIQMLHVGSYDSEPASFKQMEQFAIEQGLKRKAMNHREIYLSDARKTAPDKLRTILRFQVES